MSQYQWKRPIKGTTQWWLYLLTSLLRPAEGTHVSVVQGVIASEEEDEPVSVQDTYSGHYVVVFDPLDGSSNIDAGISTGSIFGVYAPSDECSVDDMDDPYKMMENCLLNTCQPGGVSRHFLLSPGASGATLCVVCLVSNQ